MEQSPLSHSIRNLETELKVKLFQRTTRRTWLTKAGTRLYSDAKRILTDIEVATSSLRDDGDESSFIRLALGEDLAGEPFTRVLFKLEHHRAGASVEVRELTHGGATRLVRDGGADVALTLDGRPFEGLEQRRGWAERLMLILPISHPLAERNQVDLAEIAAERLALPHPTICPGYLAQIENLFERHQVNIEDRITVNHWNTAVSFAAAGRALALCPSSFVSGATSVAVVPLTAPDAELVTWMLYLGAEDSPAVSLVLEMASLIDADAPPGPDREAGPDGRRGRAL